jgi:hypothetical protein
VTVTNPQYLYADALVPYSQSMTGQGGTAPYSWSATGLPPGLTIDRATGVISGTPADVTPDDSTEFTVSVTLADAVGGSATAQFSLTVQRPLEPSAAFTSTCPRCRR